MNKAKEYKEIADAVKKQCGINLSELRRKNLEKSKQGTFWAKVQYKKILRKMKKNASRGQYVYGAKIRTTIYVVDKLKEEGFDVYYYAYDGSKYCRLNFVMIPEF